MRFFRPRQTEKPRSVSLQQALDESLVTFELWGLEEGAAAKAAIELTKLTDEPLRIVIPAGSEFTPVARHAASTLESAPGDET